MKMLLVKPYLKNFIQSVLNDEDFLNYTDASGQKWVCVFDFVEEGVTDAFFKSIFEEFGVSRDDVKSDSPFLPFKDCQTEEVRDAETGREFEASTFAKEYFGDRTNVELVEELNDMPVIFKEIKSLYICEADFDKAVSVVKERYRGETITCPTVVFDSKNSFFVSDEYLCKIPESGRGTNKSIQHLVSKFMFEGDGVGIVKWDELSDEILTVSYDDKGNKDYRKAIKDSINKINTITFSKLGVMCFSINGDDIRNLPILELG